MKFPRISCVLSILMVTTLSLVAAPTLAQSFPEVTSANLSLHLDASDINNDGGATDPGDGNEITTWADLVSGATLNDNFPIDGRPTFIAAGSGGIGNQATVRFDNTVANGDLLFNNSINFNAQTIVTVASMAGDGTTLDTLLSNQFAGLNIRQDTSDSPAYFSGNADDFVQQFSTADRGGTITINGNRQLEIPGGFGAAHVLKAERTAPATFDGFRLSDNIRDDRRWTGDVAEIIAFDGKLSGDDTLAVESYITEKYGIAYNTALDERITESKQVALDPFNDNAQGGHIGINFHYGSQGSVEGTFQGIGFDNIDLTGPAPPAGPFSLTANELTSETMVTLDFPFTSDNTQRFQTANITGPDADTLNTIANEIFYISNPVDFPNHPEANLSFSGLPADREVFIQVLGGDSNWISEAQLEVNGTTTHDWLGVAENGSTVGTASLLGVFGTTDALGQLDLSFTVTDGNFAGIGGIIITLQGPQQVIPEPATGTAALFGLSVLLLSRRRALLIR